MMLLEGNWNLTFNLPLGLLINLSQSFPDIVSNNNDPMILYFNLNIKKVPMEKVAQIVQNLKIF